MMTVYEKVKIVIGLLGTGLFFVVGTPWYIYLIYLDFCHPEIWDQDFSHDPRIYLPMMAVGFPLCALLYWSELCKSRQMEKEMMERIRRRVAEELRRDAELRRS